MLSILIPTYNRCEFLIKNLHVLLDILEKSEFSSFVTIIISNNCSTDETKESVEAFIQKHGLNIILFNQETNIGLKANALFVLAQSKHEYVMYIGDDDYISYEYFMECKRIIQEDSSTSVIIPNFFPVSVNDEVLSGARDKIEPVQKYEAGFKTLLKNSYKGHQLSGLLLKRAGLLDSYLKYKVDNIYLFIFFTSISCLLGNVYTVSEFPVKVVQPVKKKDWGYGDDGLVNEIFDNFRKLPVSYFKRFLLELYFMHKNLIRLTMYKSQGMAKFFKAFYKITFAKNATVLFSLIYPIYVPTRWLISSLKNIAR